MSEQQHAIVAIAAVIVGSLAAVFTFLWFGWKLFVVLILWGWFSNLERKS